MATVGGGVAVALDCFILLQENLQLSRPSQQLLLVNLLHSSVQLLVTHHLRSHGIVGPIRLLLVPLVYQ